MFPSCIALHFPSFHPIILKFIWLDGTQNSMGRLVTALCEFVAIEDVIGRETLEEGILPIYVCFSYVFVYIRLSINLFVFFRFDESLFF